MQTMYNMALQPGMTVNILASQMSNAVYNIRHNLHIEGRLEIASTAITSMSDGDLQIMTVMSDGSIVKYSIKGMQDEIDSLKKQIAELILIGTK